jgi:starvation-inducible outer membrane lipoprotein
MVIFMPFRPLAHVLSALNAIKLIVILVSLSLTACVQTPPAQQASNAQQALEQAVRAYEIGDIKALEAMLPASFVGRDSLLDAVRRAVNEQRSTRIELSDLQMQTTGASQALSMRWEKRFTRASNGANVIERGSLRTVLRRVGDAWQFENLPADNLFTR